MSSQRYSELKELSQSLGECIAQKQELRELNADLLKSLKRARRSCELGDIDEILEEVDQAIAKAKELGY